MSVYFPKPYTAADLVRKKEKPLDYNIGAAWDGFKQENLFAIGAQKLLDNSDFPADENYNPSQDPQLKGYEDYMDHFYFSQSAAESSAIMKKLQAHQDNDYHNPWYYLGRMTGAVLDPSSFFMISKLGQGAKVMSSAMLAEEMIKQNFDPMREDEMVAYSGAYALTVPFILSKLRAPTPIKTQKELKELDNKWIAPSNKDGDIAIDGTFVNPNKTDPRPSGVGAEAVGTATRVNAKTKMEGESFIKTHLGVFGEDGPWTPVFRVVNQNVSLTAKKMMADLLDTPLLKLKNTKKWGFEASGKSIETDMRMMRVGEIESHKMIKDEYRKYISRMQGEKKIPSTDLGLNLHNKLTKHTQPGLLDRMSLAQFSIEVTRARLNGLSHEVGEVAAAARHSQKHVYGPLFDEIQGLKIREMPIETELYFWKDIAEKMKKTGETSTKFTSEVDGKVTTWPISAVNKQIEKLNTRLANVKKGGVKDYINLIYIKSAIEKNPDGFREIIRGHFRRANIIINEAKLNKLVDDLSNHFPFTRFEKTTGDLAERYAFNRPRYARSVRARELNLDKQAQLELLDGGYILNDIFALQKAYARSVIPDILLTRKYGDPNGLGVKYFIDGEMSGFSPGLMTINQEYRIKAQGAKDVAKNIYYRGTGGGLFKKKFKSVGGDTGLDSAFGSGIYLTKDPKVAKSYGKNVKTHTVNIKKPYKITTDNDIVELFRKAGVKDPELALQETWLKHFEALDKKIGVKEAMKNPRHYRNIKPMDFQKKYQTPAFIKAREYLESIGHDALIVEIKQKGTSSIKRRFTDDQTLIFDPKNVKEVKVNTKSQSEILKERDQIVGDLEASIELIKGTYGLPANPHSYTSRAIRTAKHYNALTMLTGFAAAIPDIARITMTSGIKRGFKTQFEMLSDFLDGGTIYKMGKKEAQSFGEAVDMVTGQRAMLFADVGDMFGVTSKLESGMGKLSAINFMYVNLMSRWTEMAKSMASVTIGSRIIEDSIRWTKGSLPDKWKTALASSGIDQDMARRIAVQFEKHGDKTKHNFMANAAKWEDDAAADAFGTALNRDINITIVTPGLGDTPLWMSTEMGGLLSQFKKFAMGATQRMMMRGMQEKDLDFMFGSLLLMGSGMILDKIYTEYRFGRDYSKKSFTDKLLTAFDRSGLAGIYTDLNKAVETLTDNRIGLGPMLGEEKPFGSSNRWKAGTIAGPTGGQIYNIFDILYDVGGNKYNHHTAKNVRRLIPFQNVWYLDWLFDDIQKGLH